MNTISGNMREQGRRALGGLAVALSLIVYGAALVYAGVRSYDLFARTLPADMLAPALLGILALEASALGLPLAIHYWTEPGTQRMTAYGFYAIDLALIIGNSILDAAHNAGTILPGFMQFYGTFAVPGLPVLCMVGWSLIWLFDPTTREHDMVAATRAGVRATLLEKVKQAADNADISAQVDRSARAQVAAIVGETLGSSERRAGSRRKSTEPQAEDVQPEPAREVGVTIAPKAPTGPSRNGSH